MFRRKRPTSRWRQLLDGVLLLAGGTGLLVGLWLLTERFDTLLLVSRAISDLLNGLARLGAGLLQLLSVLLLVGLALLALAMLVGGLVRLVRAVLAPAPPKRRESGGQRS
ncbi:hypothetical protein KBZ20_06775 [Vulcanococcus limneticus Candia 3F8]|nr:hypothetical protein [Vulcanococcus limneticus MW73D5]MCP9893473.1 hypothetical protein [Vulcanococcus limneticus Candia 3F8]MCP9896969.1 hypothetical protein [Vulcanococcus limneticus Candia 3B3]